MCWKLTGNEKGVTTVELAISVAILLLVLFGIIESSLILYNKAIITHASREAARAGSVYRADPTTEDNHYSPMDAADIKSDYVDPYLEHLVTFSGATANTVISACTESTTQITVTVTYPYTSLLLANLFVYLHDSFASDPLILKAVAVMQCEPYF